MAVPSIDVVKKIAEALDVTADTLIYGTQDEKAHWRKCSRLKCLFYNEMILGSLDAFVVLPDYIRI